MREIYAHGVTDVDVDVDAGLMGGNEAMVAKRGAKEWKHTHITVIQSKLYLLFILC